MSVPSPNTEQVIVVTGDVTMDWNIASTRHVAEGTASWAGELDRTHADWQRGGAALLADLIEAIAHRLREQGGPHYQARQTGAPKEPVVPGDPRFHHTYSLWTRFPHSARTTSLQRSVWRMAAWLGLHPSTDDDKQAVWAKVVDDAPNAALVVLDDADLGFRHQPAWWPQALHSDHRPWVVLKMSRSVAQGPLWEHLHGSHADRLVVVTTIDDLRQMEVQISRELSWERTAQDLAWEMLYNPRINALCHSAHVVVTFGAGGAMLFSRQSSIEGGMGRAFFHSRLVFDPQVIEGMWEEANPGSMIGYTSCLAAALSYHIMADPDHPDIVQAVQSGLAASRRLHKEGYGRPDSRSETVDEVVFPTGLVVDELI